MKGEGRGGKEWINGILLERERERLKINNNTAGIALIFVRTRWREEIKLL
jgi:hypothetical protein